MSQDYPQATTASLTKNDPLHDHVEDEGEEHQHHAGCQHSKQFFPVAPKIKIGRNDPCSCGSGKKYKKCCLV